MMGLEYMIYITGSADWKDEGDLVVGSGMYLFGIYIVLGHCQTARLCPRVSLSMAPLSFLCATGSFSL